MVCGDLLVGAVVRVAVPREGQQASSPGQRSAATAALGKLAHHSSLRTTEVQYQRSRRYRKGIVIWIHLEEPYSPVPTPAFTWRGSTTVAMSLPGSLSGQIQFYGC
jgi:hypothetical protein